MKRSILLLFLSLMVLIILFFVFKEKNMLHKDSCYYVDSTAARASDSGPGSQSQPWMSLEAINTHTFHAGDVISFKCGSSYTGTCTVSSSGTSGKTIRLTSYGTGNKPSFTNPDQLYIFHITGDFVEIDGLKFSNSTTMSIFDETTYMESGSILISQDADNVTVKNCEITNVGVGIKSYGLNTTITNNQIHDLVIAYTDPEQSYGAVGVSINNSNATIANNAFINCRSTDSPYGADGGAIEIEGYINTKNDIAIHHNKSTECQGFIEVTETQANRVTISYNISDDYQQFLAFDTTVTPSDFKVENNTIIRTSTANACNVFAIFWYSVEGPLPSSSWLNIRNNIFYTPACKVLKGTYTYKEFEFPHSNNLFYDGSSDPVGYSLGAGDQVADPNFIDFKNKDLHLQSSSPAINAGASLGYTNDFENHSVPSGGAPDCGVYEFQENVTEMDKVRDFESVSPSDSNIKYFGRWEKSDSSMYNSYWGGAYLRARFTGTTVKIKLGGEANIYVSIDERPVVYYAGANGIVNLTTVALSSGTHSLRVNAAAVNQEIKFQGLELDSGASTAAISQKDIIEFVGDSISTGYLNTQDDISAYCWIAAENLGCDHTQITYPGITLTDGYGYQYLDSYQYGMMSQYFKLKSIDYGSSPDWDFSGYTPKLVVINIGTNDSFLGVPEQTFQTNYINFLQNIRTKLPNTEILVLRTFNGYLESETQSAVNARIDAGDTKVHYIDTTNWLDTYADMSDGVHPTDMGQIKAANALTPILKSYLSKQTDNPQ